MKDTLHCHNPPPWQASSIPAVGTVLHLFLVDVACRLCNRCAVWSGKPNWGCWIRQVGMACFEQMKNCKSSIFCRSISKPALQHLQLSSFSFLHQTEVSTDGFGKDMQLRVQNCVFLVPTPFLQPLRSTHIAEPSVYCIPWFYHVDCWSNCSAIAFAACTKGSLPYMLVR